MKSRAAKQRGRGQGASECVIISVSDDDFADEEVDHLSNEELGLLVGVNWRRTPQDVS